MSAKLHPMSWLLPVCLLLAGQGPTWAEHRPLSKEEQDKVDQAIDRGVKFLKTQQIRNGPNAGMWQPHFTRGAHVYRTGYTWLAALALLESGVSADDPCMQKLPGILRRAAQ